MNWTNGEKGPECFCGMPTTVTVFEGKAHILCIFHSSDAGMLFPLPIHGRPANWPNLTNDEIKTLVEQGFAENPEED
jgi:hypothetical protein